MEGHASFFLKYFLVLLVTEFVAGLVLAVVCAVLLHGVVRQVDQSIIYFSQVELLTRCAQIAFLIKVAAHEARLCMCHE